MPLKVQRGVSSVETAGAVLWALRSSGAPNTLRDLATLTGLSPSRLHHYLVSLVRTGLVHQDLDSNRYALGNFALELGLVAADNMPDQHASAEWLHRLSAETGESSFFATASARGPIIVRWEQGSRPLTVHARLGTVMPVLTSATGLAWLAFDSVGSAAALEGELRRIDPSSRGKHRASRLAEAAEVRRKGIARAQGSMLVNVNALACPVLSRRGKLAGILTVLGLGGYFDAALLGKTAALLRSHATEFGHRLA